MCMSLFTSHFLVYLLQLDIGWFDFQTFLEQCSPSHQPFWSYNIKTVADHYRSLSLTHLRSQCYPLLSPSFSALKFLEELCDLFQPSFEEKFGVYEAAADFCAACLASMVNPSHGSETHWYRSAWLKISLLAAQLVGGFSPHSFWGFMLIQNAMSTEIPQKCTARGPILGLQAFMMCVRRAEIEQSVKEKLQRPKKVTTGGQSQSASQATPEAEEYHRSSNPCDLPSKTRHLPS